MWRNKHLPCASLVAVASIGRTDPLRVLIPCPQNEMELQRLSYQAAHLQCKENDKFGYGTYLGIFRLFPKPEIRERPTTYKPSSRSSFGPGEAGYLPKLLALGLSSWHPNTSASHLAQASPNWSEYPKPANCRDCEQETTNTMETILQRNGPGSQNQRNTGETWVGS